MELIEQLHDAGIMHNDIHGGNIAFRSPLGDTQWGGPNSDDLPDLVLIDFGFSSFFPPDMGSARQTSQETIDSFNKVFVSPWQMTLSREGRRDDVYRLVQLLADLMTITWKRGLYKRLQECVWKNTDCKRTWNFFSESLYNPINDPFVNRNICSVHFASGDINRCHEAMKDMDGALRLARTNTDVDKRPNYSGIKQAMQAAMKRLQDDADDDDLYFF